MDFKLLSAGTSGLAGVATDALVVLVTGDTTPAALDAPLAGLLNQARKDGEFSDKAGSTHFVLRPAGVKAARVVFAHAGDGSAKALRKAVAAAIALVKGQARATVALAAGEGWTAATVEALVTATADATYTYRATKPSAPAAAKLAQVGIVAAKAEAAEVKAGLARGEAIAAGVTVAREAANLPGNHCTPTHLAEVAKGLGKAHGLKVQVLEKKDCEKLGMGSFLAVAQGSDQPPKFIVMQYQGGAKTAAPVVLVGKGITFDTGGISLKPAPEMDEMKFDMGGAASVLGAMKAIAVAKPKLNVVGIIAACENMPSGRAVKPGDVVTSMSGQTIEILNTDAEGRLILCDALTYAERFKPAALVDVATLTGACVIALGNHRSGLFANDEALAAELLAAGEAAGDLAWRMPLDDEYEEGLKTNFADVANVGGRAGGSITAAKFLQRFTAKQKWAHLDIAGTGWKSGAAKGSTGRPVPLLVHFILGRAKG